MTIYGKSRPSTGYSMFNNLRFGFVALRHTILKVVFTLFSALSDAGAQPMPQDIFNQPLMVDSLRGLVMATPFTVGSNEKGGYLRLPDGSVIRTVWPAALEVNRREEGGEPVWPRCEPAVYSLARVLPDGRETWAKSYVYYWKTNLKFEACDSNRLGFTIHSALGEASSPGYYEMPYRNRVFHGTPGDSRGMFVLNPETGNVEMSDPPKNLRVIDAYELRRLKLRIAEEVERDMAPILQANKKLNPAFIHTREEFKRLQKALFPKPPPSNP